MLPPHSLSPGMSTQGALLTSSSLHLPPSMTSVHLPGPVSTATTANLNQSQTKPTAAQSAISRLYSCASTSRQPTVLNHATPCFSPPLLFKVHTPFSRAHVGYPISPPHPLAHYTSLHWFPFQSSNSSSLLPLSASNAPLPTHLPNPLGAGVFSAVRASQRAVLHQPL